MVGEMTREARYGVLGRKWITTKCLAEKRDSIVAQLEFDDFGLGQRTDERKDFPETSYCSSESRLDRKVQAH